MIEYVLYDNRKIIHRENYIKIINNGIFLTIKLKALNYKYFGNTVCFYSID